MARQWIFLLCKLMSHLLMQQPMMVGVSRAHVNGLPRPSDGTLTSKVRMMFLYLVICCIGQVHPFRMVPFQATEVANDGLGPANRDTNIKLKISGPAPNIIMNQARVITITKSRTTGRTTGRRIHEKPASPQALSRWMNIERSLCLTGEQCLHVKCLRFLHVILYKAPLSY